MYSGEGTWWALVAAVSFSIPVQIRHVLGSSGVDYYTSLGNTPEVEWSAEKEEEGEAARLAPRRAATLVWKQAWTQPFEPGVAEEAVCVYVGPDGLGVGPTGWLWHGHFMLVFIAFLSPVYHCVCKQFPFKMESGISCFIYVIHFYDRCVFRARDFSASMLPLHILWAYLLLFSITNINLQINEEQSWTNVSSYHIL